MPTHFHPRDNLIARTVALVILLSPAVVGLAAYTYTNSSHNTGVGRVVAQPVPFSHRHHVTGIGIDCRYCHATVETAAFAGMPTTGTCMNCHSQLWTEAELLEPVRESWRTGVPIQWNRVHDLPDFVFFNHAVHVTNGVGCATCHGRVDLMALTYQSEPLTMEWCLDCHRNPERYLRPREETYNMAYESSGDGSLTGAALVEKYEIRREGLTNCTACHR